MTMIDHTTVEHPTWCRDCHQGEHFAFGPYIPATGAAPYMGAGIGGAVFPTVGVNLSQNASSKADVIVHLTGYTGPDGDEVDTEATMRPDEAEALAHALLDAVRTLRGEAGDDSSA